MTPLTFRFLAAAACALMTTVVSAGCGGAQVNGAGSAGASPAASKSATGSPTGGSATKPAPTPTAGGSVTEPVPTPTRPSARNGTNYKACSDGRCEIAVSKRVKLKFSKSTTTLTIKKVYADYIVVRRASPDGYVDLSVGAGCKVSFYEYFEFGWGGTWCSGKPLRENKYAYQVKRIMTVKSITDGTAILDLKSW
ncbi:hypothetical protein [Streptosporangium sp. NPDC023615]|uniref:hypothetical protein n=1 Tax=Streptosporangium sp. NPDC023615 TaxID=3154794 RepID=UPI003412D48B